MQCSYNLINSGVAKDGGTRGGSLWWHPFFDRKIGEDQKKIFAAKISRFSVQMRIGTKQSEKKRYSPQIGEVMMSPQNGETRGALPPSSLSPSDATAYEDQFC